MIRLPSTMGAVDRIFRKFAQDTSWLVRYVVRQRNSWRDVALQNMRCIRADRKFIKFQRAVNKGLRAQNKKLRDALNSAVAERNRIDFVRSHHVATISATMATRDEFFRNWKEAERKLNVWRNEAAVRGLTCAAVFSLERGHTPTQEQDVYAATLERVFRK